MPSMSIATIVIVLFGAVAAVFITRWRRRRSLSQDRQASLWVGQPFHVGLLYKVHDGQKLVASTRHFVHQILSGGDVRLIYAGQVAFSIDSQQLGPARWDGLLLFELPSQQRFNAAYTERFRRARQMFSTSYLHGMRRRNLVSAAQPLVQVKLQLAALFRGRWRDQPLTVLPELKALPRYDAIRGYVRRLRAVHQINSQALVVYNLGKRSRQPPTIEAEGATAQLLVRLARRGLGLLHLGRFRRIEHNAVFDSVYVLQYPSPQYFSRLLESEYYQVVAENEQLADSLIVATVPITNRL